MAVELSSEAISYFLLVSKRSRTEKGEVAKVANREHVFKFHIH